MITAVPPAGMFMAEKHGNYQCVNERWTRMTGRAFGWTGLAGEVLQMSGRADSGDGCRFDFALRDRSEKKA
jgi:hypothetical protein